MTSDWLSTINTGPVPGKSDSFTALENRYSPLSASESNLLQSSSLINPSQSATQAAYHRALLNSSGGKAYQALKPILDTDRSATANAISTAEDTATYANKQTNRDLAAEGIDPNSTLGKQRLAEQADSNLSAGIVAGNTAGQSALNNYNTNMEKIANLAYRNPLYSQFSWGVKTGYTNNGGF